MTCRKRLAFGLLTGTALLSLNLVYSGPTAKKPAAKKPAPVAVKKPAPPTAKSLGKSGTPLVPHDKFSKDCNQCHLPTRWDALRPDFKFDHAKAAGYPLAGAHTKAACLSCHNDRGLVAASKSHGCAACHEDAHKGQLGPQCSRCHTERSWNPLDQVVQHAKTRFPLMGSHQSLDCENCHRRARTGDFKGAPTDCVNCHQADFQRAPNHPSMNYPKDCAQCHTATAWSDTHFNHAALGASASCVSCHQTDYQQAPNHAALNFPKTCGQCHQTSSWAGARFDHNTVGGTSANCYSCHSADYQTGPNHLAQNYSHQCTDCHQSFVTWANASGKPDHSGFGPTTNCYSCHTADFQTAPNHVAHNYSHQCGQCHTPTLPTFAGATFNHNTVGGSSAQCYNCHSTDYQQAPDHAPQNYPHDCWSCHKTFTTWLGATFNHGVWFNLTKDDNHRLAACTKCHTTSDKAVFTCITCHPHSSKSTTDDTHSGKPGYTYGATTCYNCHRS